MTAQKWSSSGLSLFKHTQGEVTKVTELESEVRMQVYAADTKVAQQECRKKGGNYVYSHSKQESVMFVYRESKQTNKQQQQKNTLTHDRKHWSKSSNLM